MTAIAFALPLLPGKTDLDREVMTACWRGERKAAYEDSRRRAGITRESTWIQATPGGDVAVVFLEADDLATAFQTIAASEEPFDAWFRAHVREVHGIDLAEGFAPPEIVLDFNASDI